MLCVVGRECRKQPELAGAVQTRSEAGAHHPPHPVLVSPACRLRVSRFFLYPVRSFLQHGLRLPDHGRYRRHVNHVYCHHQGQSHTFDS